jgi:3-dehydrosphinganine reductase
MEWWGVLLASLGGAAALVSALSWGLAPARWPLASRVVVITGGSSGIGKAVAAAALRAGAHVALLARRADVLAAARDELVGAGAGPGAALAQRVTVHAADVTDEAAVRAAFAAIAAAHGGRVDALVCSAGTSQPREFAESSAREFEDVWRVNVLGSRNAVAAALPLMTDGGRVVLVSSQAGQVGLYGYTSYSVRRARARARAATATRSRPLTRTAPPPPVPPRSRPSLRSWALRSRCRWRSSSGASS